MVDFPLYYSPPTILSPIRSFVISLFVLKKIWGIYVELLHSELRSLPVLAFVVFTKQHILSTTLQRNKIFLANLWASFFKLHVLIVCRHCVPTCIPCFKQYLTWTDVCPIYLVGGIWNCNNNCVINLNCFLRICNEFCSI